MLTGKENTETLGSLLHVHIAPSSGQAIKRARKAYKDVRSVQYPITEEELLKRLPAGEIPEQTANFERPMEISADPDVEPTPSAGPATGTAAS